MLDKQSEMQWNLSEHQIKKARSKIERALVARGGPEPPTSGL